jgi:hypothetical protein
MERLPQTAAPALQRLTSLSYVFRTAESSFLRRGSCRTLRSGMRLTPGRQAHPKPRRNPGFDSHLSSPHGIDIGELVKGRLGDSGGGGGDHYWMAAPPAGKYRVVIDVKLANDQHSNLQAEVVAFTPDGSQLGKLVSTNEIVREGDSAPSRIAGCRVLGDGPWSPVPRCHHAAARCGANP